MNETVIAEFTAALQQISQLLGQLQTQTASLQAATLALSKDPAIDRPLLLARYDEAKAELSPTGPDILRGEPG